MSEKRLINREPMLQDYHYVPGSHADLKGTYLWTDTKLPIRILLTLLYTPVFIYHGLVGTPLQLVWLTKIKNIPEQVKQ